MALSDTNILNILNLVATGLSLAGSLIMTVLCFKSKARDHIELKLIFLIAISDFVFAVSNLMSQFDKQLGSAFCTAEGFLRVFSAGATEYLVASTAILCYKNSRIGVTYDQKKFYRNVCILGIVLSLLFAILPFIVPQLDYGRDNLFCWVIYEDPSSTLSSNTQGLTILLVFEVVPLVVGATVNFTGYIKAIKNYRTIARGFSDSNLNNLYRLLVYPLIFFVIFLASTVDNGLQIYDVEPPISIESFHIFLFHGIGFFNALIYGLQARAWDRMYNKEEEEKPSQIENTSHSSLDLELLAAQGLYRNTHEVSF